MSVYHTVATVIGLAKLENASLLGETLEITAIKIGDGDGAEYVPNGTETALKRVVYETVPSSIARGGDAGEQVQIDVVVPVSAGGWYVRELGAFDAAGDLIFIANVPESFKPTTAGGGIKDLILQMVFALQNADSVTLEVDPGQALATSKTLAAAMLAHSQESDPHPNYYQAQAATTSLAGLIELATDAETQSGTAGDRGVTPKGLKSALGALVPAATTAIKGLVEYATGTETKSGASSDRAVTPAGLKLALAESIPDATDAVKGVVELATVAEAKAGSSSAVVITPAALKEALTVLVAAASTSLKGIVELATNSEAEAGLSSTLVVTPAALKAALAVMVPGADGLSTRIDAEMLPVGVPILWPSAAVPAGFLEHRGQAFNGAVYTVLSGLYPGDVLTDMRGVVPRGWDNGRGLDPGRALLSYQADEFESHKHDLITNNDATTFVGTDNNNGRLRARYVYSGSFIKTDFVQNTGGTETRGKNVAFMYISRAA